MTWHRPGFGVSRRTILAKMGNFRLSGCCLATIQRPSPAGWRVCVCVTWPSEEESLCNTGLQCIDPTAANPPMALVSVGIITTLSQVDNIATQLRARRAHPLQSVSKPRAPLNAEAPSNKLKQRSSGQARRFRVPRQNLCRCITVYRRLPFASPRPPISRSLTAQGFRKQSSTPPTRADRARSCLRPPFIQPAVPIFPPFTTLLTSQANWGLQRNPNLLQDQRGCPPHPPLPARTPAPTNTGKRGTPAASPPSVTPPGWDVPPAPPSPSFSFG